MAIIRAAGYTRQSKGSERSIAEQDTAVRDTCAKREWDLAGMYSDTVSASRFSRKERPGWEQLRADLETKAFDVMVIWEPSRGDRDLGPWVSLLSRCREHKVLIHIIAHDHTYNMNNARDWRALAEDGIDSAYESEKTSQRVTRTIKAQAVAGKPHGRTTYGYKRIYDKDTARKIKEQVAHPEHSLVVQEIITRIAGGVPIKTVTDDLNARGVPSPQESRPWTRTSVRRIALNPVYIGKRQFEGRMYDAMWPPLVNEVVFYAARNLLTSPTRKTTRPGKARWLLSYLAVCDVCGAPLSTRAAGDRKDPERHPLYVCSAKNHVFIRQDYLDAYVKGRVLRLLSEFTFGGDDQKALKLRGEAARHQADLDDMARACGRGEITGRAYALMEAELLPKIARLTREADAVAVPLPMRGVSLGQWDELDIAVRREVIRAAYEIRVRRRQVQGRGFDPSRVVMILREHDSAAGATGQ